MNRANGKPLDPNEPALVVTYGNTARKHRRLDREVMLLGRSRSCDFGLVAPEIADVHCVLLRGPFGWMVRDCGSRSGTRVNGRPVREAPLADGDTVQIGPFSFLAQLPPSEAPAPASEVERARREARWLRSRRNLVQLALTLRRRLRDKARDRTKAVPVARTAPVAAPADVVRDLAEARARLREYEARAGKLEEWEQRLGLERDTLNEGFASLKGRVEKAEKEFARKKAEAEAELRSRWEQMKAKSRSRVVKIVQPAPPGPCPVCAESAERARQAELRQRELDHYAEHLKRSREQPAPRPARPTSESPNLRAAVERLGREREQLARERDELRAQVAQQREQLARSAQAGPKSGESERQSQQERVRLLREAEAMKQEMLHAHEVLARHDQERAEAAEQDRERAERQEESHKQLREEAAALRRQLQQKENQVRQLQERQRQASREGTLATSDFLHYEAELNNFRRQIEADRLALNDEIEQLRLRNAELDEAAREAELQLSRERAQLARERVELNRIREEIRMDKDRAARADDVRGKLGSVLQLRGELAERRQSDASAAQTGRPRGLLGIPNGSSQ